MGVDAKRFASAVLEWFGQYGRHGLPWQKQDAYRIWLSEIMLQQTQVSTVIPYYADFLARFPSIESLAKASIDDVLQRWQGLGYYARARNLHRSAQLICEQHGGQFPQQFDQVLALPGIGRSTAGAILSFAYGQNWPILDGNVKRVLARCFQVPGWYAKADTMKQLWRLTEAVTPDENTADFNQAMMDIGATVCFKSNPKCEACPLQPMCASFQQQSQADYPQKKPKRNKPLKQTLMLLHRHQDQVMLWRRPPSGIWGGLWSLPEVENDEAIEDWQQNFLGTGRSPNKIQRDAMRHQFTHFNLDISLATIDLDSMPQAIADGDNHIWVSLGRVINYGMPTPVRKLLNNISAESAEQD